MAAGERRGIGGFIYRWSAFGLFASPGKMLKGRDLVGWPVCREPEGGSTCANRRLLQGGGIPGHAHPILPLRNSWISSCTTSVAIHLDVLD